MKVGVFGGIDVVDAACQHGDRAALERALMCRPVDAARQPGDHDEASPSQVGRQLAGEALATRRGHAGAHHRDGGPGEKAGIAPGPQRRGRRVQRVERSRKGSVAHHEKLRP